MVVMHHHVSFRWIVAVIIIKLYLIDCYITSAVDMCYIIGE